MLAAVKRRTVSISDAAVDTLERLARKHTTNVSCVVEAAAGVIAADGSAARELEQRIVPDRRGGRRAGAGRKKGGAAT